MLKKVIPFLLLLMMGAVMTGCYFDPFYDGGYSRSHGERGHEDRGRGYGHGHGHGDREREHSD